MLAVKSGTGHGTEKHRHARCAHTTHFLAKSANCRGTIHRKMNHPTLRTAATQTKLCMQAEQSPTKQAWAGGMQDTLA